MTMLRSNSWRWRSSKKKPPLQNQESSAAIMQNSGIEKAKAREELHNNNNMEQLHLVQNHHQTKEGKQPIATPPHYNSIHEYTSNTNSNDKYNDFNHENFNGEGELNDDGDNQDAHDDYMAQYANSCFPSPSLLFKKPIKAFRGGSRKFNANPSSLKKSPSSNSSSFPPKPSIITQTSFDENDVKDVHLDPNGSMFTKTIVHRSTDQVNIDNNSTTSSSQDLHPHSKHPSPRSYAPSDEHFENQLQPQSNVNEALLDVSGSPYLSDDLNSCLGLNIPMIDIPPSMHKMLQPIIDRHFHDDAFFVSCLANYVFSLRTSQLDKLSNNPFIEMVQTKLESAPAQGSISKMCDANFDVKKTMVRLIASRKFEDLVDMEEFLQCYMMLSSPCFVDMVNNFFQDICKDILESEGSCGPHDATP